MPDSAPYIREISVTVGAQATAATLQDQAIGEAPFDGTVTAAYLVPEGGVTANATNFRTFRLVNKGQAGAGSTLIASFATNVVTTNDLVAFDEKQMVLSGTAANLVVAAGDVLIVDETVAASGVAHTGYKIVVQISRA